MSLVSFIHTLGSSGLFPSRAFLPAFVTALLVRFGSLVPFVAQSEIAEAAGKLDAPPWFACNASLVLLGILSCLECWATKDADVREFLEQFDGPVKSGMALLTSLGVASAADAELVRAIQQAGVSDGVFGLVAAGAVYCLASARRSFYELLTETDSGDSLGLQKLCNLAEDAWVVLGAVLLVVFPLLMIFFTAVVFGLVYLWRKAAQQREEGRRVPCASCGKAIYRCAAACAACNAPNRQACSVNWLGQPAADRPADPAHHAEQLIAAGRCRHCATRLRRSRPRQTCECCGRAVFAGEAQIDAYLGAVHARFARTLLICFLLGLAPVLGVVPAIVFYRFHVVNPLRQYVPFGSALAAKWIGRFACLAVLSVQWIPLVGIASLPIMASINYAVYRRAFQSAWRGAQSRAAAIQPLPPPGSAPAVQPQRQWMGIAASSSRGVDGVETRIEVVCPACERAVQARAEHIGKRAKCKCGHVFVIELRALQAELVEGPIVAVEVAASPILIEKEHAPEEKKGFWFTVKGAAAVAAEKGTARIKGGKGGRNRSVK